MNACARSTLFFLTASLMLPLAAARAQTTAEGAAEAEAYYQFMLGRYLEGEGDATGAIAALERAAELSPGGAEIRAELAGLYARQNRAEEAIEAGEAALAIEPENVEAHRVLGTVYSALSSDRDQGTPEERREYLRQAVDHLERARPPQYNSGLEYTLARLYMRLEDYDKAIVVLRRFVEQEPGIPDAVLLLARAYEAGGRRADAIGVLRRAVTDDPGFHRALTTLGDLYEAEARWDEAAEAYGKAAIQNPRNQQLPLSHARVLLNADRVEEARKVLNGAVEARPTDAGALFLLTQAERRAGDLAAAERTARRLIESHPEDLRGPYSLALLFEQQGQPARVIEVLQPAVEGAGTDDVQLAPLLTRIGFAYLELGRQDEAIAAFERAATLSSDDAAVVAALVQAYLVAGRADDALARVAPARRAHPEDSRLARLHAEALLEGGKAAEAIALMREWAADRPDDPGAQVDLGAVYANAERWGDAERVLQAAREKFPQSLPVLFQLGAVYEQQDRVREAEAMFEAILARDPRHAPTLNYLGYMLAERGDRLPESIDYIKRALDEEPNNPAYLDSLGWAYFRMNRLEDAEPYLRRAGEQMRTNSVVQDHLGQLLFALGQYEEAIAAWERALAGDGEAIDRGDIETRILRARQRAAVPGR